MIVLLQSAMLFSLCTDWPIVKDIHHCGPNSTIAQTLMIDISETMVVTKLFYFIILFVITSTIWEKEEVVELDMFSWSYGWSSGNAFILWPAYSKSSYLV